MDHRDLQRPSDVAKPYIQAVATKRNCTGEGPWAFSYTRAPNKALIRTSKSVKLYAFRKFTKNMLRIKSSFTPLIEKALVCHIQGPCSVAGACFQSLSRPIMPQWTTGFSIAFRWENLLIMECNTACHKFSFFIYVHKSHQNKILGTPVYMELQYGIVAFYRPCRS